MFTTIFFMYSGETITKMYDDYPSEDMIITSGIDLDAVGSYETHY